MKLIAPFDLVSRFPAGQSVVFVGNSGSLRAQKLGNWIDSFDIIVRFNEARTQGFEQDLGSRTDILVSNPYVEARKWPALDGLGCKVVLAISSQTRRGDASDFERWAGDADVLHTYSPDLIGPELSHTAGATTGVYGVHLLTRILDPSRRALTGFTFFTGALGDAPHYWSDETPPGVSKHDMDADCRLMTALINRHAGKTVVTADVANAIRARGQALDARVQVKPLAGTGT